MKIEIDGKEARLCEHCNLTHPIIYSCHEWELEQKLKAAERELLFARLEVKRLHNGGCQCGYCKEDASDG